MIDTQPDRQHREHVEQHDPEERRLDRAGDRLVRSGCLASSERDELDAAVRVERPDEGLGEGSESSEEGLIVVEVRETLQGSVAEVQMAKI